MLADRDQRRIRQDDLGTVGKLNFSNTKPNDYGLLRKDIILEEFTDLVDRTFLLLKCSGTTPKHYLYND